MPDYDKYLLAVLQKMSESTKWCLLCTAVLSAIHVLQLTEHGNPGPSKSSHFNMTSLRNVIVMSLIVTQLMDNCVIIQNEGQLAIIINKYYVSLG